MAKVRVHELAKKYDVPSKDVLSMLSELGEFVKAPSSTVEPPVVKRFEDKYGADLSAQAEAKAAKKAAKKAPAKKAAAAPAEAVAEAPAAEPTPAPAEPLLPRSRPNPSSSPDPVPARSSRLLRSRVRRRASRPPSRPRRRSSLPPSRTPTAATRRAPAASAGAGFKPGPRPARPGAPRPGNNPFSSTQGMGSRPAPTPGAHPPRVPVAATSARPVRRPAATACRAPTRR